ncbi:hypothetical protein [Spirosoma sordidisoli]|uniref:Uncharacterized protein n=1 Tax=Spirosoma sordidisoli TaxID=2502893 RepID=A0A4Q2UV10_9BACT|nr:hypothetical protein [Spirosoma sordidisoli]RYC70749.1 hypothetical protein EQG79_00930 [Spirosoma sordidisoli]
MTQQDDQVYGRFVHNGTSYRLNPDAGAAGPSGPILRSLHINDKPVWLIDDAYWIKEPWSENELPFDVDVAFYAFRYCLGRMTYVVYDMAEYLINHADAIDDKHRALIISEIDAAIEKKQAGWDMDVKQWQRVKARLSPAYRVRVFDGWYTMYVWDGKYYLPNMQQYMEPSAIIEITPLNGTT